MTKVSVAEAQTIIEELIERAQKGERIILTEGPDETPIAQLSAIKPVKS